MSERGGWAGGIGVGVREEAMEEARRAAGVCCCGGGAEPVGVLERGFPAGAVVERVVGWRDGGGGGEGLRGGSWGMESRLVVIVALGGRGRGGGGLFADVDVLEVFDAGFCACPCPGARRFGPRWRRGAGGAGALREAGCSGASM